MKRKVHRAFVEELPKGHPENWEQNAGMVAVCFESLERGGTADADFIDYALRGPIERALSYLESCCTIADHVL